MSGDRLSSLSILHMHMQAQQCRYWQRSFRIFSSLREMSRLSCSYIYSLWYTNVHLYQQYQRKKNKQQSYWPFSVFSFFDVWKIPLQIMGNGISEALKIKLFWARMPQTPPPQRLAPAALISLRLPVRTYTEKPRYAPVKFLILFTKIPVVCVREPVAN